MLGDMVESALESVGISKRRVEKWLGVPCDCEERKEKLNQLDRWARRIVHGKVVKSKEYLERILSE